jgi:ABC-type transporter Mla subunit MlaD
MSSTVTELIGKESISDAAEKARKGIRGLSDETKSTSSTTDALSDKTKLLQGIFNGFVVTAVVAGLKKITETAFECYQEFGEMDRRMQQLKIALGNNEESFSRNVDLIESLTQKTLSSKDEIENLIAELASLGKSDSQIQAIATAAVSLANITGKDLNSSFQLLNATYSGTTGRLSQIIPEIKNLTKDNSWLERR